MNLYSIKRPLLSVIIPVFNTQAFLERCLLSVLNQQVESLEVIVVDDASPDKAGDIAESFFLQFPMQIRCIRLKHNVGLAAARNIGLRQAQGHYIGFVDSDDFVDASMYRQMIATAELTNADIVSCGLLKFNQSRLIDVQSSCLQEDTSVCNKLFRHQLLQDFKIQFPKGELFEDEVFSFIAAHFAQRQTTVGQPLYYYRMNPTGICRRPNADQSRLYARMSSLANFMLQLDERDLVAATAAQCVTLLCRHAMLQINSQISWSDLLSYWHFTHHLIQKYQLESWLSASSDNYFISRYARLIAHKWQLWLLYAKAAGGADEAA